ncbi:MAG: type ISP restriction/modification enzyme [Candidatus Binataceae bacterium]|jgi:predicted helicase
MPDQRDALRNIRTFPQLIKFLRDELDWPIDTDDFEELTFDYTPEELGIDTAIAAKIEKNGIKRLRPLSANQPWGIFFVKFEPKRLPVVALRRVLSRVVLKKRASANSAERAAWQADDLLFVSNYGEGEARQISFAHFSTHEEKADLPTLKVLGWDSGDTPLHLDDVADTLTTKLAWPEDEKDAERWREQWRSAFTLQHREVINTSKALAVRLADLARAIRDRIKTVLDIETENGPVTKLMKAFQLALIHDLSADDFADMYAQTIAYGLLSARVANPAHDTADAVATHIPVTNPFLKDLMETFLHLGGRKRKERGGSGIDFDELGVSEVVELLDSSNTNMEAVVRDFDDRKRDEDPVIYFYELFLKEYDAKKRIQRGVFYTPQPVVSYIVRSVHELLQTEFGLEDGLASTATWSDMAAKHPGLKIPDEVKPSEPFVVILDPATGTATFLVEVIDVIYLTLTAKWKQQRLTDGQQRAAWNEYVPEHLLPRLHGYELMMAPYAIAHMKIGIKLYETGYRFGSDERARIYLTNSLEPASDDKRQREFEEWVPALAHEAQAVNAVKRHQRFTVVIGNPPYSAASHNPSVDGEGNLTYIGTLMRSYYQIDGVPLGEKNPRWLQDDYVKFLRVAQLQIQEAGLGVVGMITNHGYLANPTFRGMRYSLLKTFSAAALLDLHGNTKRGETAPDGTVDENVFDIQQGVAISLWNRMPRLEADRIDGRIQRADLWGSRRWKYEELLAKGYLRLQWRQLTPVAPFYLFVDQNVDTRTEYEAFWRLPDVFPVYNTGVITKRDDLTIGWTRNDVWRTVSRFVSLTPNQARAEFDLPEDVRDWKVEWAQRDLRTTGLDRSRIKPISYRPFDTRFIYYTGNARGFVGWPVEKVMRHLIGGSNYGLISARSNKSGEMDHFFITRHMMETKCGERTTQSCVFPLFLVAERDLTHSQRSRRPNVESTLIRLLEEQLGSRWAPETGTSGEGFSAETLLFYSYATFHSQVYRTRYAEFLKIDFPRLPLTSSLELFSALARLGGELIALHLLESPKLENPLTTCSGPANPEVEKVSYSRETVWLDKSQTHGFRGVPEAVWNFHVGGYQVCEKWLKDRKGRTLSKDDMAHYQKIVVALSETIRLMEEIDEVIDKHGGWPGAFSTKSVDSTRLTDAGA